MSYLVNHCAKRGNKCTLITLSGQKTDTYEVDPAVDRVALDVVRPSSGFFDSIFANRRRIKLLRRSIADSRPNLVISFCDQMNVLSLMAVSPLVRPDGITTIICERSDPRKQRMNWFWEQLRKYYYPKCDACVVQTQAVGDYLKKIIGSDRPIHVIPTAFQSGDLSKIEADRRHPLRLPPAAKRLLFAGRLSSEKGLGRVLKAWETLHAQFPDWRLIVAGEGEEKKKWDQQRNLTRGGSTVDASIDWLGWVPDIRSVMLQCDAFVLPSYYEGFPNALVEAMDCGLPSIATDCSASICQIIAHRESGLIVENSEAGVKLGLAELMQDDLLRAHFRERANASVAKFRWSNVAPLWDNVLATQ